MPAGVEIEMSGLLLCGKTADRPFYVKEADINLYSMEELCYFVYNNVYMIGQEFFSESLIKFIEEDLELVNVAKKLKDLRFRQEPYSHMIKAVLDGCCYYSESEKESLIENLNGLEDKSAEEKMKARADMLAEKGRLNAAAQLYKKVIAKVPVVKNIKLAACVWNNLGVIYAKQFLFTDALSCFKKAYDTQKEEEYKVNLICAAVLMKNEECLKDIMTQYEITENVLERYRHAMQLQEREIRQEKSVMEAMEKLTYSSDMELSEFYKSSGSIIDMWKKEYREQIR